MTGIVVGVERSPAGQHALDWAVQQAVARRVPLLGVRAWQTPKTGHHHPVGSPLDRGVPDARAQAEQLAVEELELAQERVAGGADAHARAVAVMGAPARVLLDQASGADLVVVGGGEHGALARVVLGSVTSAVLHGARCPVAIVPPSQRGAGQPPRVVVGVDHSPESLAALRSAVQLARRARTPLVPVFAHEPALTAGSDVDMTVLGACERRSLLSAALAAGAHDLVVDALVVTGPPVDVLRREARPQDVLVLGSRGRGGVAGMLLGSTSTACAQHPPCPVVVVRGE